MQPQVAHRANDEERGAECETLQVCYKHEQTPCAPLTSLTAPISFTGIFKAPLALPQRCGTLWSLVAHCGQNSKTPTGAESRRQAAASWLKVRLTRQQTAKLERIARKVAPEGTPPTLAQATRWLIERAQG